MIEVYGWIIVGMATLPFWIDLIRYRQIVFENPLHIPFLLLALFMGFRLVFLSSPNSWGLFQNLTGIMDPVPVFESISYYVIASMIAMMAGYYLFAKPLLKTTGISLSWSRMNGEGLSRIRLPGLIVISLIFLGLIVWSQRQLMIGGFANTSGYIYMLNLSKVGLMMLITAYLISRLPYRLRDSIFNPTYIVILIAYGIYLYTSFSTQGRFMLVAPFIGLGILLLRFNPTSIKLKYVFLLSLVIAFFYFNLAGALRIANEEGEQGRELNFQNIYRWYTERLSTAEDFNGVEGMAFNMVHFNDEEGYLWGKSYAAILWHWWPRGFVKEYFGIEKPFTVGIHLKGVFLDDSNKFSDEINRERGTLGFSSTFVGQNYENFGFVGGTIFAFFMGAGLALLFNWVTRRYYSISVQTFYACFLASMPSLARGGAIAIDLANGFMGYLPVLVVFILFKAPGARWFPKASPQQEVITDDPNQMPAFPDIPGVGGPPGFPPAPPMPVSRVKLINYPQRTLEPPVPNKLG
ncbi:hypothetical protein QQ054_14420 [Oscillatoria amoena NRMC-F 0135]|nr:hypothetical protein [Oscillatoria amoena NRMC-F 0135]